MGQTTLSSGLLRGTSFFTHYKSLVTVLRSHTSTYSETCWSFLTFRHFKSTVVTLVCSCLSFHKVKHNFLISLSKSQHFLSTSFYPMPSAFQVTTSNCLPSLQRLHECWLLIILAAFSPQISILHLLFQSLLFQYSFYYFSFYNLLDFLDLLLQFI